MKFNSSKCELLKFGSHTKLMNEYNYFGPGMDNIIIQAEEVMPLGIIITPASNYNAYLYKTIAKFN